MDRREDTNVSAKKDTPLQMMERQHPYMMMLLISMGGIIMIFAFLLLTFTASVSAQDAAVFPFPKSFYASTIFILTGSVFIQLTKKAFERDNFKALRNYLFLSLSFAIAFGLAQVLGWFELYTSGFGLSGPISGAYLYVISGLHLFHLAGGMLFMGYLLFQIQRRYQDPIKVLISVTNPYERLKLRMLRIYWHFIDALWIVLFVYFWIML